MIEMMILGNVGADATIKHFDGDRSVVNFSIAHTENRKNKEGVKVQHTTWVDANYWGKPDFANKIAPYIKKGKKLFIKGEPSARAYIPTGGGDPRATLSLNVFKMEFADGPVGDKPAGAENTAANTGSGNPAPEYAPPADISSAAEDDDLPF